MEVNQILKDNLSEIINDARLAPSVHNTQPWQIRLSGDTIFVLADKAHTLKDGDPTGRQLAISLGIFAETIVLSAQNRRLAVKSLGYKNNQVEITFTQAETEKAQPKLSQLLNKRCSDRSVYKPSPLSGSDIAFLKNCWSPSGVKIWVKTERDFIKKVSLLTSKGIRLALTTPGFRKELANCLTLPWSKKKRGIAVTSLYIPYVLAILEPLLMRLGIGLDAEARLEKKRWDSASAVILLTAEGDMPEYWFLIGRAYIHASLAVEELGLSQATSAAIVEASTFHEDIEALLDTEQRIQSVIRIGKGARRKAFSPRLDSRSIITSTE